MANSIFIQPGLWTNNGTTINPIFPIALTDGTVAAPSLTFASETSKGWYSVGANAVGLAMGGVSKFSWDTAGMTLNISGSTGVRLVDDAANTLAQRSGTAAQQFNVGPSGNAISLIGSVAAAASFIEGLEGTAPAAGAANSGRIFFQDNGGGKTQLMVIFNSGAAQQIAIQP